MFQFGGPKLLLDRRASSPRTPGCLASSQTTPEGTPVRLAPSQSAQGDPPPSRTTGGPPGWSMGGRLPVVRICVDQSCWLARRLPTYGEGSRP